MHRLTLSADEDPLQLLVIDDTLQRGFHLVDI